MPIVPRYDSAPVQPAGIPGVRVNSEAPLSMFGGGQAQEGVTQALTGLNKDAFDIAQAEKQKADDTATKDAQLKYVQLSNDIMFNPKSGAVTKQGQDAFGIHDEALQQYDKGADGIEQSLTEDQKRVARLMRQQYRGSLENDLNQHMRGEAVKFETETFKSLLATNQNDAILHYQDPQKIQDSISVQERAIVSHGQQNGMPAEWVKQATEEAASKTHAGVIDQYLALGQDMAAKKYYDSHKDDIGGEYRTEIDKKLEEGTVKGEAQRTVDRFVTDPKMKDASGMLDINKALEQTKKIDDIKLRDETERRLEHANAVQQSAITQKQTSAYQAIGNLADQTTDLNAIHADPNWSSLSIPEKNATDAYVMDKISGKNTQTDRGTFHDLNQMAVNERQKFLDLNISSPEYKYKLSEADFKFFDNMQRTAKQGDSSKLDGYEHTQNLVDSTILQGGIDPKNKSKENQIRYHAINDAINASVADQEKTTGKKPTQDEVRKIAKQQMIQVITDTGFFSDTKKRLGELNLSRADQEALIWATDHPNDSRADAIRKRLKQPATD